MLYMIVHYSERNLGILMHCNILVKIVWKGVVLPWHNSWHSDNRVIVLEYLYDYKAALLFSVNWHNNVPCCTEIGFQKMDTTYRYSRFICRLNFGFELWSLVDMPFCLKMQIHEDYVKLFTGPMKGGGVIRYISPGTEGQEGAVNLWRAP